MGCPFAFFLLHWARDWHALALTLLKEFSAKKTTASENTHTQAREERERREWENREMKVAAIGIEGEKNSLPRRTT